ncbi:MAG TPA: radical SAM protein [Candidatus Saccharimonadales bacterium]|nr:radical SAM protein [Candidatus Saccharimonadales bacterium]
MQDPFRLSAELFLARGKAQDQLHEQASTARRAGFDRQVFLRAVVEVSNFCRENCSYCGMRRDNQTLHRFRAKLDQLTDLIVHHRPASVRDINIQTGEDPVAVREIVIPLVKAIRRETDLGVSVCLGTLNERFYKELQAAGATTYIIKFETADPDFYARMGAPGTLKERIEHIRLLAGLGWNVSSGFIVGLPKQTIPMISANLELARQLPLAGCSVSPFIPGESTPLSSSNTGDINLTLNCMALLRLLRPDWVIPAVSALNLAEPNSGYRRGLRTGANLVTINMTPSGLREDYLLYKRDRFIMTEERILSAIEAEGLVASKQSLAAFYAGQKPRGTRERHATVEATAV